MQCRHLYIHFAQKLKYSNNDRSGNLNVFFESLNVPIMMISIMITIMMSMMMDFSWKLSINLSFIFSLVVDVFNDHLILCGFP